jgi:LysM repeat protein
MNCNFPRVIVLVIAGLSFVCGQVLASPQDSIGVENINGQLYVIHKVAKGETLYSISRRYKATMNDIVDATPEVKKGLMAGMTIRVPYQKKAAPKKGKIHTVAKGETLYSISRIYGVTYQQLMQWNDLPGTDIKIGQRLAIGGPVEEKPENYYKEGRTVHIVQQGEGLYAIAREHGVSVEELMEWNNLETAALQLGQELIVKYGDIPNYVSPGRPELTPSARKPSVKSYEINKIIENGLATMIEGTGSSKKYLALHRTAPVGTLIAVRNEMNDQMVFVRVVGVLPDTGINDKVIIRISEAAYNNIGAIDPRFRVELSYLPN